MRIARDPAAHQQLLARRVAICLDTTGGVRGRWGQFGGVIDGWAEQQHAQRRRATAASIEILMWWSRPALPHRSDWSRLSCCPLGPCAARRCRIRAVSESLFRLYPPGPWSGRGRAPRRCRSPSAPSPGRHGLAAPAPCTAIDAGISRGTPLATYLEPVNPVYGNGSAGMVAAGSLAPRPRLEDLIEVHSRPSYNQFD